MHPVPKVLKLLLSSAMCSQPSGAVFLHVHRKGKEGGGTGRKREEGEEGGSRKGGGGGGGGGGEELEGGWGRG